MSTSLRRITRFRLALLLLIVASLWLAMVGSAAAEGAPYQEVPGYPKYGCYDVAAAGIGMWSGKSPYQQDLLVPGPVVDAYLFWIGVEDRGAPNAPNQSDLIFNGVKVVGDKVDFLAFPSWYMWRANLGPSGYNLIKQGMNKFVVEGWEPPIPVIYGRNGLSVVAVYETGSCTNANRIDLISSSDFYAEKAPGQPITDPMIFTFPAMPSNQWVTVWMHHAGTDEDSQLKCRPENIWVASGAGSPPNTIIKYGNPSTGMYGGTLGVKNGFQKNTCGDSQTFWPAADLVGWVHQQGPTAGVGGYIGPQWSIIKFRVWIPAGTTWLALQAESTFTGNPDAAFAGESGAWFGQLVIPAFNPELKITKTDGVDTAKPGDSLTYTLKYENYGYGPAENTTIVDKLPQFATYVSSTPAGTYDPVAGTVTWNVGKVEKGASGQVQVTVKLDPVFEPGTTTLTNQASISTTTPGEQDLSDNSASDTTNVVAKAELSIAKTAAPEPVDAGAPLVYTINWNLGGDAYAYDVTVVDTLPANVVFDSASAGGTYDPVGHKVTWVLGSKMTPPQNGTLTVNVTVKTPLYNGTKLENLVVITDKAGDKAEATATSTVRSDHQLSVAKTDTPDPVEAGAELTYKIDWATTGNEPSPNAMLVDTLPDKVTLVSVSSGSYTYTYDPVTRQITWALGELMTPVSGSFTVVVKVASPQYDGTKLTNVVDFKDDDPGTAPQQATVETTVHADHTLDITKTDSPDPVEKGTDLTYTIGWSVSGNEFADNVVVTDQLPFGTQFVSASDGGTYDPGTGLITWNLGNKVPGDSGTLTLVVKVNKDFPNMQDIVNRAAIKDYKPDKEKNVEEKTKVIQTGAIGDLVWYDCDANGVQDPGTEPGIPNVGLVLYAAGADNLCGTADDVAKANAVTDVNGRYRFTSVPAGTYCVKVLDATLPAGVSLTSGTNPHGPINLPAGEDYLKADFGYCSKETGQIGDRVWRDTDGDGVQDAGELGISDVTLDLLQVGPGGTCETATKVASTTTGANGLYLFANVPAGQYCVKVTDTLGKLTGLTLTGGTNPHGPIDLPAGGTYLNADFGYKDGGCDIGDLVFYDANRNGVFEPAAGEPGIGGVTLNLLSAGADAACGTADDTLVGTTVTGSDGRYLFTGVPDGKYCVVVTDVNGRLTGYTNTYGAPNTDNNGQVSPYPVTIAGGVCPALTADFGYADDHLLVLSKTHNPPPAMQPVEAGAEMVYTINYSVTGREKAVNVIITDVLPPQVDFVSASSPGTYDAATRTVSWKLGDLVPGTNGAVTLTVLVKKPLPNNSFIYNTAVICDDARVCDQSTDIVMVHAEPILSLTKTNDPSGEVKPGDTIKYTLCYANTGNGNATGVILTDAIPVNTTYVAGSATGSPTYDPVNGKLTWNLGVVGPDVSACVSFQVKVNMTIIGLTGQAGALSFAEWSALSITNTALLRSNEKPDLTATTVNPLNATVDLAIYKSASATTRGRAEPLVFTVTVTNRGTANATNLVVSDPIHPKFNTLSFTSSKGTTVYDPVTRVWSALVPELGPGETLTIVINGYTAWVPDDYLPYEITDMATVSFTEGAPRNSNKVVVTVVYLPSDIPEPGTWLLLGSGLAGLAGYARLKVRARRRKVA